MAYVYRDAVTGEFVTQEYAIANPTTTIRERADGPIKEQETDSRGDLYHDEMTMKKVHDALTRAGLQNEWLRVNVITELQNAGILFRERGNF